MSKEILKRTSLFLNSLQSRCAGKRIRYYLGGGYPNVYLIPQEAKCLFYCLQKFTSKKTAEIMKLSFRTVEYYRDNIRCKVGAFSKRELISKIKENGFIQENLFRCYYLKSLVNDRKKIIDG
jgi:DNA-binding CsgD family transcriptional regulator